MLPVEFVLFIRDYTIFFAIYLMVALSLNLEYGYGGVPNFGKVLAVAGGAYTVGFLPGRLIAWLFGIGQDLEYVKDNMAIVGEVSRVLAGDPVLSLTLLFTTLGVAAMVGAVLGFVASYPAIRLREDYLSITLLVMGEAIQVIGYNYTPIIGGTLGISVPDPFGWAGELRYMSVALFVSGICLALLLYLERFVRTPLGRMLRAIRDNEEAAEALGKDATRTRMKVIVMASAIGAVAGALDAFKMGGVISMSYHRVSWTFWPWVIVILGGAANNMGTVCGTFAFVTFRRLLDYFKENLAPYVPFSVVWLDYLMLGLMLILVQMYRPGGLIPEKYSPTLDRKKLEEIAESTGSDSSSESTG